MLFVLVPMMLMMKMRRKRKKSGKIAVKSMKR
jgi:hypothetical protein